MSAPPVYLHPFARPAAPADRFLRIVGGEGATVVDADGRRYIDALASLWFCNVGHGRQEIVDAVAAQMGQLAAFHTFERFTNDAADRLCEELAALAPLPDARVHLTSGGSEAVDSAFKLARIAHHLAGETGRHLIISRRPSYHGVTYGGVSATGLPANQAGFGPFVCGVIQVGKDDVAAVEQILEERGDEVAAVVAEPVVGAGGVHPPVPGYLARLRELCDAHGAFLILDEVICGFGRLGRWWGAQRYDVVPDLMTFAKAVTSGYQPLGGVLVGPAVHARLASDDAFVLRHGHTYSGHPAACAAGLANLEILQREGLVERADKVGQRLAAGLRSLADEGAVDEVRGDGAVWGVGVSEPLDAVALRDAMLERGVIVRPIGTDTLAFCPPLVIDDAEIDQCVTVLAEAIAASRREA